MSSPAFYSLDDLRRWPEVGAPLHPPARLAVIGDPIAHSRSPAMHNPALSACGMEAQYIRVHVPPGQVAEAVTLFAQHGFIGVNCTIPHKFEALEVVNEVDPLARQLGAVNTIRFHDSHTIGYNTDGPGFLRSVQSVFGRSVSELRVLILGAGGGAGRAVAMQCVLEKCPKLILANRTVEKLAPLESEIRAASPAFDLHSLPWEPEAVAAVLPEVDLIVNSSPLGMKPQDPTPFDLSQITSRHLIYDMVYRPPGQTTPLIAAAKKAGAKTCDGLELLLHQGALSFEHWFQRPAPLEVMRQGLAG